MDFRIRSMQPDEIAIAVDWAAAEGWNPGLHDALPFSLPDPEGFLLGLADGEPVASISAVRYGEDFGFIGFYIVKPDWRSRGYGWRIWQAAMARLAGRNIGLDGVVAQQDNYRRSGFRLAHRNIRYRGAATPAGLPTGETPQPLGAADSGAVAAYDRAFFPAERAAFLAAWISRPATVALGLRAGGGLRGYAVARPCREGWKIGPLFADDAAGAETLFAGLCRTLPAGAPLFLDVPACHAEAIAFAAGKGMEKVFETARMYTGPAPDLALDRTWGICSFELG